ncbi:MAG: ABC transporter ATP-binding protein [Phycisphaerales bacterium]|nr:ABC transporter ATP-binding protein [Phycisphaerales bacterium]
MILVREISKSFGSLHAVNNVSFELPTGQIAGLLGPNGAGKSTTIRMITGFLAPDKGSISIVGHDIQDHAQQAQSMIGYLPESAPIYPEMSVKGYLKHRAKLYRVPGREIGPAIEKAMGLTRISNVSSRRVGQLSKGYRQRVGLAAALVHNPQVLILDEPTNGLDPTQIHDTRSLIRELSENRTTLVCSHILPEVERTCDRVIVMAGGQVRADGSPSELINASPGPVRYIIEIRTNPSAGIEHALRILASIPGVAIAKPSPIQPTDAAKGWSTIELEAAPAEDDLREAIAASADDNGLFIRELRKVVPTLESLFMQLVDTAAPSISATSTSPSIESGDQ